LALKFDQENENMDDYQRIKKAIIFLESNYRKQPSLQEIADHIALSPFHAQRLFTRWAGISPKRFSQYLTLNYAKSVLEDSASLMDAAYDSGLSGTGRLHDLFVTFEAMTPGEYRQKGKDILIHYGVHPSPFGKCLIGATERGICWLSFFDEEGSDRSWAELTGQWPGAELEQDQDLTAGYISKIFNEGAASYQKRMPLFLKGTNFQVKVWEALLKLPPGKLFSYENLAASIGKPKAVRAAASAISQNPVAYLIPCHRVLRKSGRISGYRWGPIRKKAIIAWEAAQATEGITKNKYSIILS
jgi:AraC family transcriptional regulator of adaptative response/methylated-DNA-[protein]-cysteine methyltransferase